MTWADYSLSLHERTHVMGILNVTPDSFADGGLHFQTEQAIEHGLAMARDGADIIDVGGESTRPYAEKVSSRDELARVIPVIEALSQELTIPISIDTYKAEVANQALKAGASIINDISALRFDPHMIPLAEEAGVPVIIMHMKGTPADMQRNPVYGNLIPEIISFLRDALDAAIRGGIREEMLIIDPGIGFGKTFDHNLEIIRDLTKFKELGSPILLGSSRKAFIGHIINREPSDRDTGTMATVAAGVLNGAHIVRVHNVKMAVETVQMMDAIKRGSVGMGEGK
ncbi:MAG: dihydropteroate synthase [Deltaproteobacteria bacterium]|nr:dihydropteroate synthase [Deltaproteobacteria bacterium]